MQTISSRGNELRQAVRAVQSNFFSVGLFSCVINLLMLTGPLFMLQVYDRVLASGSVNTLLALAGLAAGLYLFMGIIDVFRSRVLVSVGHRFEATTGGNAFSEDLTQQLQRKPTASDNVQLVGTLRSFFSGQGIVGLFDLPWMPVYLGVVFSMHVWLGLVGLLGAVILLGLALLTDHAVRRATSHKNEHALRRAMITSGSRRNAEAVQAMGMQQHLVRAFKDTNSTFLKASADVANVVGFSTSFTKVFRLMLQSAILGVGAYLAIQNQVSPGVMIAASIIIGRALQPIETITGQWQALVAAQRAWRGLKQSAIEGEREPARLALPKISKTLVAENLAVVPPAANAPTVRGVNMGLMAGEAVAVIGPSGGGKSSLGRALVGAWPAAMGEVRLDDVPLSHYRPQELGAQVGFVPQDTELLDGSVAENIARFDPNAKDDAIVEAAKAADVHGLISSLPDGYATMVGERGAMLSGGQRQRIALARALYGNPFLIVLDEPNSNLDVQGEGALNQAILNAKARGAVVVVIAHRPSVLAAVDKVLVVEEGQAVAFGPRDEIMHALMASQNRHGNSGNQAASARVAQVSPETTSQSEATEEAAAA